MKAVVAQAVATQAPAAEVKASSIISLEAFVDLLEDSTVTERIDLGTAIVYRALHAVFGAVVLINTSTAQNVVMYL